MCIRDSRCSHGHLACKLPINVTVPFLDIPKGQCEPGIEPDRVADDFWREAVALKRYRSHPMMLIGDEPRTGSAPVRGVTLLQSTWTRQFGGGEGTTGPIEQITRASTNGSI